jgi:DNA-binding NtrC family response regulator
MRESVLIVDDEVDTTEYLGRLLRRQGYLVSVSHTLGDARARMASTAPDVVLVLPDGNGADLVAELGQVSSESRFIVITAHGSIPSAVESTRRGAVDYLTKPIAPEVILFAIRKAIQQAALTEEARQLRGTSTATLTPRPTQPTEYRSPAMRETLDVATKVARQDGIVLILGESGTGKDWLARWIHGHSRRAEGPFFGINCAALPRELAESELFGHEPGAFTGTRGRKRGLIELAERGSLLLNEIGELDLDLQSKLLTFLDTRSFMRIGGERPVTVDARIIAATNRELANEVTSGKFRGDLYYRLNVVPVRLPPLRERPEDIPRLVDEILDRLMAEMGLPARPTVTPDALRALRAHPWPGNVRELRNLLERALVLSSDGKIHSRELLLDRRPSEWSLTVPFPTGQSLHEVTADVARGLIAEALRRAGSLKQAAALLGISRHSLAHQMKALGLDE